MMHRSPILWLKNCKTCDHMDVTTASSFSTFYHWDIFADSAGCQPAFDFNGKPDVPGGTRVVQPACRQVGISAREAVV